MKGLGIFLGLLTTLFSTVVLAGFDDTYEKYVNDQYVFSEKTGIKYSISLKEQRGAAVCTVALNDGYGAFSFLLLPGKETDFDVIYEDYEGDSDYEYELEIACDRYYDSDRLSEAKIEFWKEAQAEVRARLGENGGYHSARNLEEEWSENISFEENHKLSVNEQGAGYIVRMSNAAEKLYICGIDTDNTSDTLYLVLMPDNMQTFHIMADKKGNFGFSTTGCSVFSLDLGYTIKEVKQRLIDNSI
ncbi:hypothetical protein TW81_01520 [Vibrio galatheae]|uniref:Uncharacterized protein n=1 Tax=Vibrio galatheae TaxID=579748 RepID=A0A0F4NQC3_9VIBR|nr:hypothetical protein [Vibrio galatheae]KJY85028.1 hypothetical protein TW81_01520 [Vibrio galatheae]